MKPKDPLWSFFNVIEDGSKKIIKCKDCGATASGKSDRLPSHREKCAGQSQSASAPEEQTCKLLLCNDQPPKTPARKRPFDEIIAERPVSSKTCNRLSSKAKDRLKIHIKVANKICVVIYNNSTLYKIFPDFITVKNYNN